MTQTVKFNLILHNGENADKQYEVLRESFSLNCTNTKKLVAHGRRKRARMETVRVVCTSEQFAKFLILRHQKSLRNGFAELDACFVEDPPCYIDLRHSRFDLTEPDYG